MAAQSADGFKTKANATAAQSSNSKDAHKSVLDKLPLSEDLLSYYRKRIEKSENELLAFADVVNQTRVPHMEQRRLLRELQLRVDEIQSLQNAHAESQQALEDERTRLAQALAENDELRIQELKDRRKIKYLLSVTAAPNLMAAGSSAAANGRVPAADVVTYFRPAIDNRLVSSGPLGPKRNQPAAPSAVAGGRASDVESGREMRDIETESLQLQVCALRAQLVEQAQAHEERMARWRADIHLRSEEESLRARSDAQKITELSDKIAHLQETLRDNTKELVVIRKNHLTNERILKEERYKLEQMLTRLRTGYNDLQSKCENMEKIVETRISRKKEAVLKDLKLQVQKLDQDLSKTREELKKREAFFQRRIVNMREKSKILVNSYKNLKRRRAFEIEGFTNDIIILRKKLRDMEQAMVRSCPDAVAVGEEREIRLLSHVARGSKQTAAVYKALGELRAMVNRVEEKVM